MIGLGKKQKESAMEMLNFYFAISYLGMSQYDLFLEHIGKVTKDLDMKYFWLSVFYLIKNDIEQAKANKEKISECERTKKSIAFLDGFLVYRENQFEDAKKTLEEVYPKLNYRFLQNIASDIINEKI